MQGTPVWPLVQEDPTCREATKPMHHNYWSARATEPVLHDQKPPPREARALQPEGSPYSSQLEKANGQHQRPNAARNKQINFF